MTPSSNAPNRTAVELCAGLGGIGIGLRALGFHIAKAYDSWDESVATYNHNFGEVAATCNLLSEKGRQLVRADRRKIGELDLLAAGPPCKGFSRLKNGHHDGRNGHNRVLVSMPDYVAILRPRMFLIENVPDLIRHRGGRTLSEVIARLERPATRLRYRVEQQIYDAALFGTPQARRRILILGVRHGAGDERLPKPGPDLALLFAAVRHGTPVPAELEQYLEILRDPESDTITSAEQALSDLPQLGPGEPEQERPYASEPRTAFQRWARNGAPPVLRDTRTPAVNEETVNRLRHISPGGCARMIPREHLNGLSRRYDSAYRRLHPCSPSTALSTKYDCVYHYAQERSLSVREYARLQGIPDRVTFPAEVVCRRSAYEMIGNSVPPRLIERVLGDVLRSRRRGPNG
jgi:DNA (cytosine-5)-methyltransferase 1